MLLQCCRSMLPIASRRAGDWLDGLYHQDNSKSRCAFNLAPVFAS
jgi:hypothetical protein